MTKKFNQYIGKAGHLAVMSEFLMRGWNVAIPEVDIGDDIFVVQDANGILRKVQVKTSIAKVGKTGFSGQFSVSLKNLEGLTGLLGHYVFIVRHNNQWTKPVIVRQDDLLNYVETGAIGSVYNRNATLYFSFTAAGVSCSGHDFTKYLEDYSDFPVAEH